MDKLPCDIVASNLSIADLTNLVFYNKFSQKLSDNELNNLYGHAFKHDINPPDINCNDWNRLYELFKITGRQIHNIEQNKYVWDNMIRSAINMLIMLGDRVDDIKFLMNDMHFATSGIISGLNSLVRMSARYGRIKILRELLQNPKITIPNDVLAIAAKQGNFQIVEMLLKFVDPSVRHNAAIISACSKGHTKIVKLLLSDQRSDPSDMNNLAIILASKCGNIDIVKLLLTDIRASAHNRVNPAARNNIAIISACKSNRMRVISELLAQPQVDPSDQDNDAIISAYRSGNKKIVSLLYKHHLVRKKLLNDVLSAEIPGADKKN